MSLLQYKNLLFSGSADHTIRAWDTKDGSCLTNCEGHRLAVSSLAATADFLISGSFDGRIRLWTVDVSVGNIRNSKRKIVSVSCAKVLDGTGRAAIHNLLTFENIIYCARERNKNEEYNTIPSWAASVNGSPGPELPSQAVQNLMLKFREKGIIQQRLSQEILQVRVKRRTASLRNKKIFESQLCNLKSQLDNLEQVHIYTELGGDVINLILRVYHGPGPQIVLTYVSPGNEADFNRACC